MGKRGRKPNPYKVGYFYEREENAVVQYIESDSLEFKNKVFEEYLKAPLTKMIESIIRRYNLRQDGETFEETFDDALAFIISKMDKYKQENGRAFSYLQTICKNHLLAKRNEINKNMLRNVSFDEVSEDLNENEDFSYNLDDTGNAYEMLISNMIISIDSIIENQTIKLSKNEVMVGIAIKEILKNAEDIYDNLGSNKFNKSSILMYIKDTTNLHPKDIRNAMRKYKILYYDNKKNYF